MSADDTSPVYYEPDGPDGNDVKAVYADGTKLFIRRGLRFGSCPVRFEGTEGWVEVGDSGQVETFPKSLMAERRFRGGYPQHGHVRNFLNCVKTRQQPAAPAEGAHRAITACHVGNIAIRLGRPVKWDPKTERVIGDDEAQRMTVRPYRAPWRL